MREPAEFVYHSTPYHIYLYKLISFNQFSRYVSYPLQLSNHHHITTKEYKKFKIINLSHMIFILNFIFTILFYAMR
jgi:hypothetical protein